MRIPPDDLTSRIAALCRTYLRPPAGYWLEDGVPGFEFDPPLTTEEQATLDSIAGVARMEASLTPTLYSEVRSQMQTLRALRQLGRNAFMAQTAAERDRQTYDCLVAVTEILLRLTRD